MSEQTNTEDTKLVGVLAQFNDPGSLVHACEHARDDGFKKMDAYTPFPIHGIEKAIGIPRTILPFIVLAVGITGCLVGLGIQWFVNGTESIGPFSGYQFKISGKPLFSLPANIPVAFEVIVLLSAFAAFFGMLILNRLPRLANPLHRVPRFRRVTNDRFFLMIEATDAKFDEAGVRSKLEQWGATDLEDVREDLSDHQLPAFLKTVAVLGVVVLMIPPVMIYRMRNMTNTATRMHVVPDMDFQIKYKAQAMGPVKTDQGAIESDDYFFSQKRAAFVAVPGTIPRGGLRDDSEFYRGIKAGSEKEHDETGHEETGHAGVGHSTMFVSAEGNQDEVAADAVVEPDWVTAFPHQVDVSEATLARGNEMFDIYCSVCHGYAGDGDGLVNMRAESLNLQTKAAWTAAKSLYDPEVVVQPVGRIFDTITNGRATMGPYASRIEAEDRWAIVLYLKTLHESRRDVPFVASGSADK